MTAAPERQWRHCTTSLQWCISDHVGSPIKTILSRIDRTVSLAMHQFATCSVIPALHTVLTPTAIRITRDKLIRKNRDRHRREINCRDGQTMKTYARWRLQFGMAVPHGCSRADARGQLHDAGAFQERWTELQSAGGGRDGDRQRCRIQRAESGHFSHEHRAKAAVPASAPWC